MLNPVGQFFSQFDRGCLTDRTNKALYPIRITYLQELDSHFINVYISMANVPCMLERENDTMIFKWFKMPGKKSC